MSPKILERSEGSDQDFRQDGRAAIIPDTKTRDPKERTQFVLPPQIFYGSKGSDEQNGTVDLNDRTGF